MPEPRTLLYQHCGHDDDDLPFIELKLWNNSTFQTTLELTDENDDPTNMTGWEVLIEIRDAKARNGTFGNLLYTLSTANSLVSLGTPTAGLLSLTIPFSDAVNFTWTHGYFDALYSVTSGASWFPFMTGEAFVHFGCTDPRDWS